MKSFKSKCGHFILLYLIVSLLSSCATSIVKKPEVYKVKKVAILSLYADQKVPEAKGRGIVMDWDDKVRMQVAEDALTTFQQEFNRLGWEVVSPTTVIESKVYQETFSIPDSMANTKLGMVGNFLKNNYQQRFFTPAGMLPIPIDDKTTNQQLFSNSSDKAKQKAKLGQMAKELGVDAVVLTQLDYCYQGGAFSMLGTGEAVMTAGSSIKAINQEGEFVVNMPNVERCDGDRGKSNASAFMMKGNLYFTRIDKNKFRKMFKQATRESASITIAEVDKAMSN